MIRYEEVSYDCKDFIVLTDELDLYLNQAIGGEEKREKYKGFNHLDTMDYVIVSYEGSVPIGCAALRQFSKKEVELKRVFVRDDYRNKGVAAEIVRQLIDYSKLKGYHKIILETGEFLQASIKLYTKLGFQRINNYGTYVNMEESVCMGLELLNIKYSFGRTFNKNELKQLFQSVGWLSANYSDRIVKAFQNAGTVISAWDGNKLIGLIEVLDDGELTAYIHYLLVRPEYQRQGIGKTLLTMVREQYKEYLYLVVISENQKNVDFYKKMGFSMEEEATPLKILSREKKK